MGYRIILDNILPVVSKLLEDAKPEVQSLNESSPITYRKRLTLLPFLQVRHTAGVTLVKVSELIKSDDLGQHVLTIVLVRSTLRLHLKRFAIMYNMSIVMGVVRNKCYSMFPAILQACCSILFHVRHTYAATSAPDPNEMLYPIASSS